MNNAKMRLATSRATCSRFFAQLAFVGIVASSQAGVCYINMTSNAQSIDGIGGCTAWLGTLSSGQVNTLFGNSGTGQIGLSVLRVRIDPGGQANWGSELANAKAVVGLGGSVIATPWTPPASMKSNGSTVMGSLNTSQYAAYATYLNSFSSYFYNNGVSLRAISLNNEPDANVTYESCVWTATQIDNWVKNNASVLYTPLMLPESESFVTSLSDTTLNDTSAVGKVGAVAGHLYGVSPSYYTNAFNKGKPAWMTEHYISGNSLTSALSISKEMIDSFSIANYSMYVWWWVFDPSYASGSNMGLINSSGGITPGGYALAHFAKWVRPGYVRKNCTYNPSTGVYTLAFNGSGHTTVVALNNSSSTVSQTFTFQNGTPSTFTVYQSSSSGYLQNKGSASLSSGSVTYSLPANSITTFEN